MDTVPKCCGVGLEVNVRPKKITGRLKDVLSKP
jgi:hypothetical protein